MDILEANKVWKEILKIVKKDGSSLNIALENTEVAEINKNIWTIVIKKDISYLIKREIFDHDNDMFIK